MLVLTFAAEPFRMSGGHGSLTEFLSGLVEFLREKLSPR